MPFVDFSDLFIVLKAYKDQSLQIDILILGQTKISSANIISLNRFDSTTIFVSLKTI